ncbi:hypothetical protein ACIBCD_33755 [Nocardia brasiliensis]|uniref:hypothetical protein n=1 Tax=Nocardia brasiliensis TaxID=37326 RepID=UPI001E2973C8|nr:hypothetical protein [Nocardia brasiliensis]
MPDVDGLTILRHLRAGSDPPVVAITVGGFHPRARLRSVRIGRVIVAPNCLRVDRTGSKRGVGRGGNRPR